MGSPRPDHDRRASRGHPQRVAGDRRDLDHSTAVRGADVQPRRLLLPGPGRAAARRFRPLLGRPRRQSRCAAGQRQHGLDHHHRALRADVPAARPGDHLDHRRQRGRGHHAAALRDAARPGADDVGRAASDQASRRQADGRAVAGGAQPAGADPPDRRRAQRDADGGPDGGRHRAGARTPSRRGHRGRRHRRRDQGDRRCGAAVPGVDLDSARTERARRTRARADRLPTAPTWRCSPARSAPVGSACSSRLVFGAASVIAGVGIGWLTALSGSDQDHQLAVAADDPRAHGHLGTPLRSASSVLRRHPDAVRRSPWSVLLVCDVVAVPPHRTRGRAWASSSRSSRS